MDLIGNYQSRYNDILNVISTACLVAILLLSLLAAILQYLRQDVHILRLYILDARTALYLPALSILVYIPVWAPSSLAIVDIVVSIIEGCAFYSFFCLVVTNMGGPQRTVKAMEDSGHHFGLHCSTFCSATAANYYKQTIGALHHMLITRPVIVIINYICQDLAVNNAFLISVLLKIITLIIIKACLVHILITCK